MLELAKNITQLNNAGELLEEVIIVNNNSTEDYSELNKFIQSTPFIPFNYYDAPENLGVAKGRNFALQKSNAPIIIMLDDDAVLQNNDALVNLVNEFNNLNTEFPIAIVSCSTIQNRDNSRSGHGH